MLSVKLLPKLIASFHWSEAQNRRKNNLWLEGKNEQIVLVPRGGAVAERQTSFHNTAMFSALSGNSESILEAP